MSPKTLVRLDYTNFDVCSLLHCPVMQQGQQFETMQ